MKKLIPVLLAVVLLCIVCCSIAEEKEQPEILAIYSCPETQIITGNDRSKELADTVIFLYQDHSYVQYVENGSVFFTEEALQEYIAKHTYQAKPEERRVTYRKPWAHK